MSSFARAIAICASSAPPVYRGYLRVRANTEFVAAVPPNPGGVGAGGACCAPAGCAAGAASTSAHATIRATYRSLISLPPLGTVRSADTIRYYPSTARDAPETRLRAERGRRPLAERTASTLP